MMDLKDKRVLVIGLGRSGLASVRYLASRGALVVAEDARSASDMADVFTALDGLPVELHFGKNDSGRAAVSDMIVMSPGVSQDLPGIRKAMARGVPVVGEMELAVCEIDRPIIAVTGTNGKTTTTSLIGHLLKGAGISVCVAGNIGTPLVEVLDEANGADFVVLEVSSFQADTTPSLAARIGVWLNATPDHIDRHGSFENYVASKAKIFSQMSQDGLGIYNAADEGVSQAVLSSRCKLVPFDATGSFLSSSSSGMSSRGWFAEDSLWIQTAGDAPCSIPIERAKLAGFHNRENMLAAALAAQLAGASCEVLEEGLASFEGLPHRMQLVGEIEGVRYYDDSKGTNVGATARAIEGFQEPVVLIAGGLSKGADFGSLVQIVGEKVKETVLMGQAAEELERVLGEQTSAVRASSMEEAVRLAKGAAAPGDVVLLSPACASFDMFKDYADRGRAFVKAVGDLGSKKKRFGKKE